MLRRRPKLPVLAEIASPRGSSSRPGALGREELQAYSGLATALAGSRAVLATGPMKSTVALGLATVATAWGRRVALLECDLAEPRLAGTLGLRSSPGLSEYLSGAAEAPQILQSLVLAGPASGRAVEPLACIVAGEPSARPAPLLLASQRARHATARLRNAYDLLVVDGPSLGGDLEALRAAADLVDATILCSEADRIPKKAPLSVAGLVVVE